MNIENTFIQPVLKWKKWKHIEKLRKNMEKPPKTWKSLGTCGISPLCTSDSPVPGTSSPWSRCSTAAWWPPVAPSAPPRRRRREKRRWRQWGRWRQEGRTWCWRWWDITRRWGSGNGGLGRWKYFWEFWDFLKSPMRFWELRRWDLETLFLGNWWELWLKNMLICGKGWGWAGIGWDGKVHWRNMSFKGLDGDGDWKKIYNYKYTIINTINILYLYIYIYYIVLYKIFIGNAPW